MTTEVRQPTVVEKMWDLLAKQLTNRGFDLDTTRDVFATPIGEMDMLRGIGQDALSMLVMNFAHLVGVNHPATIVEWSPGFGLSSLKYPSPHSTAVNLLLVIGEHFVGSEYTRDKFGPSGSFPIDGIVVSVVESQPELNRVGLILPRDSSSPLEVGCYVVTIDRNATVEFWEATESASKNTAMLTMFGANQRAFGRMEPTLRRMTDREANVAIMHRVKESIYKDLVSIREFLNQSRIALQQPVD